MKRIVRIDLSNDSLILDSDDVFLRMRDVGLTIEPKADKALGYKKLFWPWAEIRQIKEYDEETNGTES